MSNYVLAGLAGNVGDDLPSILSNAGLSRMETLLAIPGAAWTVGGSDPFSAATQALTRAAQHGLNRIGSYPHLQEDGILGAPTKRALGIMWGSSAFLNHTWTEVLVEIAKVLSGDRGPVGARPRPQHMSRGQVVSFQGMGGVFTDLWNNMMGTPGADVDRPEVGTTSKPSMPHEAANPSAPAGVNIPSSCGTVVSKSQISTTAQAAAYACAGYKVSNAKSWSTAKYYYAAAYAMAAGGGYLPTIMGLINQADSAAAQANAPAAASGAAPPISTLPSAPPVPLQVSSAGLGGGLGKYAPLALGIAAGFFLLRGKGKKGKAARRPKARRGRR